MDINELILGKYRLLEYLGSGSFSSVFRAREEMTNRIVAIKALTKDAYPPGRMQYLFNEIKSMSKICGHPNIVSIHTVEPGEDNYLAWIIMEYIGGPSLHQLMQKRELALTEVLNIGLDISNGLKAAHAQNILHRDIKPQNILLTQEKEAKIADFSIARIFSEKTEVAGTMTGTQRYMAPEQHYGAYDYRADLYATGLILYEAATGHFPFSGEADEIDRKKAGGEVENLEKCPEGFRNFLLKALHRDVTKRYQTAAEMHDELDSIKRGQYEYQASILIQKSTDSPETELAGALERCRKAFRLQIEIAEKINQNLFFSERKKNENIHREKIKTQLKQHYVNATQYAHNNNVQGMLQELHEAHNLCLPDMELANQAGTLFQQIEDNILRPNAPTAQEITVLIEKLPEMERRHLRDWFAHQQEYPEEVPKSTAHRTQVQPAGSYRVLIEEASPEFLLDKIHTDIQYPHEEEAAHIYQQAQMYIQQKNRRRCYAQYKKLGAFYQKHAKRFMRTGEMELVANCYTRARFAYAAANKPREARKNAKQGALYYASLARQLEMLREWPEAGKSYIFSAANYRYAQLDDEFEKYQAAATTCYFKAAEGAHLNGDLQTAHDYYMLILTVGETLKAPTSAVLEAQELIAQIQGEP